MRGGPSDGDIILFFCVFAVLIVIVVVVVLVREYLGLGSM